jgi:selenocysteine-specific elongation factor
MTDSKDSKDSKDKDHAAAAPAQQEVTDANDVLNVNVGVLGHVDSGKTSLVKALSTLLSTAALDKSKQSRQRGMTLDLGFSCFFLDLPAHLKEEYPDKKKLQITLVDCPGHASLIRTIIGGAQIIDMVLLVVDSVKGWQAQTTECLVLAELTSPHLVVALNKADQFEAGVVRETKLREAEEQVRVRLRPTRFANAPVIGVAACVGGEKVAATPEEQQRMQKKQVAVTTAAEGGEKTGTASTTAVSSNSHTKVKQETYNMDQLVRTLCEELPRPNRTNTGPFFFSIDHCFQIRGRGTVLTGTVLSGSASVTDLLEFPTLATERKIKSMQMFKQQVQTVRQGDRAGICVGNLDAKLIERSMAATPGAVQLLKGAIALVRKVPYFPGTLPGGSKFHISVGHATVMATVTFWGATELAAAAVTAKSGAISVSKETSDSLSSPSNNKPTKETKERLGSSSLGGDADMAGLPHIPFDFNQDFLQQDGLLESLDGGDGDSKKSSKTGSSQSLFHWALLDFQTPVYCPLHSLIIGSRLDTVDNSTGTASSCRLAFSGRLMEKIDPEKETHRIRLYKPKERRGVISRLGDPHRRSDDDKLVRYEVFGSDLFKAETNMKVFLGMKVETEAGEVGEIKSSFGTSGKIRVYFQAGTEAREGDALIMRFKRFMHDPEKGMHQDAQLSASRPGARIEVEKKKVKKALPKGVKKVGEVVSLKGDVLENGKHNMAILSGFFAPEVNIKDHLGVKVLVPSTKEEGSIVGPFGKAGKCKVSFEQGISVEAGTKAELQL